MAKGYRGIWQGMAGDTKCGSSLAIFCIPTHFVGDTLSGATPDSNSKTVCPIKFKLDRYIDQHHS